MPTASLRTKFLLALVAISASITTAVLLVVRHRVELRAREEVVTALDNSIVTFDRLQQQREFTLERSAALLAALPTLKALMTSEHPGTIQDASGTFWQLVGSQIFALADREGTISAFHTTTPEFPRDAAQTAIRRYLAGGDAQDWWFGAGHLFQVFLQPIALGESDTGYPIGLLAVGYEINQAVAADISRVASGEVAFAYDRRVVVNTVAPDDHEALATVVSNPASPTGVAREVRLGAAAFLARTVSLSRGTTLTVSLTVLKSLDETSAFLENLNRWILGIGVAGILVGSLLVFLVSTTFTRPLARLVSGVEALERGDYEYPLEARGSDEVSTLTGAFNRMRRQLQATQRRLIDAERLATIGRVASTISHDLRHPLTAIQAYAEFLAERDLTEAKRHDYLHEIRLAVNHMTDELNALLGFSRERQPLNCVDESLTEVIDRAIRTVKALPEFEHIVITGSVAPDCRATFDPARLERAMLNLLFNAAEAVSPSVGRIDVTGQVNALEAEIRVIDNGPGIPDEIAGKLFEPFVSYGKPNGTGLGLSAVQNVMQQHGGTAVVEYTGPHGTAFVLRFPRRPTPAAT